MQQEAPAWPDDEPALMAARPGSQLFAVNHICFLQSTELNVRLAPARFAPATFGCRFFAHLLADESLRHRKNTTNFNLPSAATIRKVHESRRACLRFSPTSDLLPCDSHPVT